MKIGLQINDFTWPGGAKEIGPTLARIARAADAGGFDPIGVMDHFFQIRVVAPDGRIVQGGPPENEMLEAYTTLGYLAANTSRARLLTIVTGVVYRYPAVLAKIVTTLDVLSGGRAMLGIGAAWNEEEAKALGIPFPPLAERFEWLEDTLEICRRMWNDDQRRFVGKRFTLERPLNRPLSVSRPHPPIMIGGSGERKTLRLVAKYADACNLFPRPDVQQKLDVLKRHCEQEKRNYDEIEKTCMFHIDLGERGENVGPTIERLRGLSKMGFTTVMGGVKNVSKIEPLEIIARDVIPAVAAF
jgi:F420-dependent oxidoreductase-like protein